MGTELFWSVLRSGLKRCESEHMGQLWTLSICVNSLAVNIGLFKRMGNLSPKYLIKCPQKDSVITVADWLTVILLKQEPFLGSAWKGKECWLFCLTLNGKYKIMRGIRQRQEVWTRWLLGFTSCSQVQVNSFPTWIKTAEWSLTLSLKRRVVMWRTYLHCHQTGSRSKFCVLFLDWDGCHLKTKYNKWSFSDIKA